MYDPFIWGIIKVMKNDNKTANTERANEPKKTGYVWDAKVISIAKKVGNIIRENEENEYRRLKIDSR